jgi:signal transduction histidine kinase
VRDPAHLLAEPLHGLALPDEPRYMICAMHLVRWGLQTAAIEGLRHEPSRLYSTMQAIAKICDVELAIMLETYGDEYTTHIKRRERLAAIGQLGASISHEVKNPLGVIASSVYALQDHCRMKADDHAARHLEKIQRNVEQANRIVTTLLDFLRAKPAARVPCDWNGLVAEAAEGVHLPPEVRVELKLAPETGRAAVDPLQITRVVANLVQNAAEAMVEAGGLITVETRSDDTAVELSVRDRGRGLPSDVLPQLFEPLFTTKAVGTGLGLALAKAIVEAHQGSITASNAEGGGATFTVRLPRLPASGSEEATPW